MPLTLTLSPQAGRGDLPRELALFEEYGAAYPFAPLAGRRWRQPDEGRFYTSSGRSFGSNCTMVIHSAVSAGLRSSSISTETL